MKKTIAILLALLMVLSLVACGGNDAASGGGNDTPDIQDTQDDTQQDDTNTSDSEDEAKGDEGIDKNDTSSYLGTWETEEYTLTFNKGGIGKYEVKSDGRYWDFTYEVKDEVIIITMVLTTGNSLSSFELNEDGSILSTIQNGLPYYRDGDTDFSKQ